MSSNGKTVQVSLVLDRTGSMESIRSDAIGGYNTYIDELKKSGDDVKFTLTMFDSQSVDVIHDAVDIGTVPHLTEETYQPRAMTPLYDAIMTAVQRLEGKVGAGDNVIFAVLTDGLENASRKYKLSDVKECITAKQNVGWMFAYLGADQNAWAVGKSIGVAPAGRVAFEKGQMRKNIARLGRTTKNYVDEAKAGTLGAQSFADFWEKGKEDEEGSA